MTTTDTPSTPIEPEPASVSRRTRVVRAVVIAAIALIVANLIIVAIVETRTGTESQTNVLPQDVTSISPVPGSTVRPQDTISVDLRDGLIGDLYIDGRVIPVDQTTQVPALGVISFRPGPGKEITQFSPGRHSVEIRWRALRAPVDMVDGSYSWEFGVA